MKKSYVKPQVYFESFQLSANIAGNCKFITNHQKSSCGYQTTAGVLFFDTMTAICDMPTQEGEKYCYDNPVDEGRLFTS